MAKSKIEWTSDTWNPIIGCSPAKGSEQGGCRECYAQGQVHRFGERYRSATGLIRLGLSPRDALTFKPTAPDGSSLGKGARWTGEVWLLPEVLEIPLRRRIPTTYFVNSLSDLFHESIVDSDEGRRFIAALFGVMAATPQHTYQILTKRPEKAREWFEWLRTASFGVTARASDQNACNAVVAASDRLRSMITDRSWNRLREASTKDWPLPNVWIGTSVENQATADTRIPELVKIPAAVRFISCEPLIGAVDLAFDGGPDQHGDGPRIHWVIAGGENGHRSRPMHPDWARSLRDQCVAAGVPFFFKQWGEFAPWMVEDWFTYGGAEKRHHIWIAASGDSGACWIVDADGSWSNWTGDPPMTEDDHEEIDAAVMARVGKAKAGRELDGRTWDEMPGVSG